MKVLGFMLETTMPGWWILKLDDEELPEVLVNNLWVCDNRVLRPGDEVAVNATHLFPDGNKVPYAITLKVKPKKSMEEDSEIFPAVPKAQRSERALRKDQAAP